MLAEHSFIADRMSSRSTISISDSEFNHQLHRLK